MDEEEVIRKYLRKRAVVRAICGLVVAFLVFLMGSCEVEKQLPYEEVYGESEADY